MIARNSVKVLIAFSLAACSKSEPPPSDGNPPPGPIRLKYIDPVAPNAKLLVVRNAALSTNEHLVLDLKVGAQPVTAFGVALTIPFTSASVGMVDFPASGGLTIAGPIQPGTNPTTAAAKFVRTGPLANTWTAGVAKHKSSSADTTDVQWPAGSILFSVALDMVAANAQPNTAVFQPATLQNDRRFRAAALRYDGTEAASKVEIAIGDLSIAK